jgi:signal transduction histidine kinase
VPVLRFEAHPAGKPLSYLAAILAFALLVAAAGCVYLFREYRRAAGDAQQALVISRQSANERDMAQKILAQRLDEERELAREKTEFIGRLASYEKYAALAQLALGAAHEINNPLLGIFSHLELELKNTRNADDRAEIEQCIAGAKRISSTIRGLLDYARPGPPKLARISLQRMVDDTISFLAMQPMFRNIKIDVAVAPGLPLISADANQISQVLVNLLLNAAQAMPEGGAITIAADKVRFAEQLELRVTDTGCGIPSDILPRVFEPFFTTKRGQGTGLGLSISQAFVQNHKGEMTIDSIPQRGTTVRIRLPIRQVGHPVAELEEVVS